MSLGHRSHGSDITPMANFDLNRFGSAEGLAMEAAREWLDLLSQRGTSPAPFTVALAGGRIAGTFFSAP
jgi:hypothetical protein